MIETYFAQLEQILQAFPNIQSHTLQKKIYNVKQGHINSSLLFNNGHRLDFVEFKDMDRPSKVKYRYHYMARDHNWIFRYDNAPLQRNIATFPHHKHSEEDILESTEPTLFGVLLEIAQQERTVSED